MRTLNSSACAIFDNVYAGNYNFTNFYIPGADGNTLAETDVNGNLLHADAFANGQVIATFTPSLSNWTYNFGDWLGTKRIVAKADGTVYETCYSLPFGEGLDCTGGSDPNHRHFTGKERDQESGLDYFGARYYASNMGRWMSPDWSAKEEPVPYAKLGDPQTLNLYGYVRNNPLTVVDPDGHSGWGPKLDCKGSNSGGGGCQHLAAWDKQHGISTDPPPPPSAPPAAVLHTSIKGGYTEFMWTDKKNHFHDDKIDSLVKADHRSKPGAGGPFKSEVVGQIRGLSSPAYGPEGAQIDTGDSRGRWVHGGGSSLADPYAPNQKLTPTFGCTRACNIDVQRMAGEITNFQSENPGTAIPYSRTDQ